MQISYYQYRIRGHLFVEASALMSLLNQELHSGCVCLYSAQYSCYLNNQLIQNLSISQIYIDLIHLLAFHGYEKLKLDHLPLAFLLTSQLKMFSSLDWNLQKMKYKEQYFDIILFFNSIFHYLVLPFALQTLNSQHQLLGCLCLLPQDGFGLTSESLLLTIIPDMYNDQKTKKTNSEN